MGGSGLKASVAVAIVVYIWIHNVAFNMPLFVWTSVYISSQTGRLVCAPQGVDDAYTLATRITNFYVPLAITWTSYIGIIYRFRRSMNKAVSRQILVALWMTLCIIGYRATGWFQSGPLRLTAQIFKIPEPVTVIFGTLQRRFVLQASISYIFPIFVKFEVVPPCESQQAGFRFRQHCCLNFSSLISHLVL